MLAIVVINSFAETKQIYVILCRDDFLNMIDKYSSHIIPQQYMAQVISIDPSLWKTIHVIQLNLHILFSDVSIALRQRVDCLSPAWQR